MPFGLDLNIESKLSNFLEGGNGITALRRVDWAVDYLWTIEFIPAEKPRGTSSSFLDSFKEKGPQVLHRSIPPTPFDKMFPASDVNMNLGSITSRQFKIGQTPISIPDGGDIKDLEVTFYDDQNRSLLKWMRDWVELDLKNDGQFMSGLKDSHDLVRPDSFNETGKVYPMRQIRINLLSKWRDTVMTFNYWVYPDGAINFQGSQGSSASNMQVRFIVVGEAGRPEEIKKNQIIGSVKEMLGRFI